MELLEVKNLSKYYKTRKQQVRAVEGVSFTVPEGTCLGLVGESGSGKSTVAGMIAGLIPKTSGKIIFQGQPLYETKRSTGSLCGEIQMVFQTPAQSFDPRYQVLQAVLEGAMYQRGRDKEEMQKEAWQLLSYVGLSEEVATKSIRELSGGECQRVAIARALLSHPKLMIFDEATSSLDVRVQAQIMAFLLKMKKEVRMTFLFITHDLALASEICDQLAVMQKGRIVEAGSADQILFRPQEEYTKELLSSVLT